MTLTPFVATTLPSHDYTYFAHAAPGLHLKELQFGMSGAKLLDNLVPGLFVQARYGYAVTEKTVEFAHNRSLVDLEVGYFVTPRLRLMALTAGQRSHGGLDLTPNSRVDLGPLFEHHDRGSTFSIRGRESHTRSTKRSTCTVRCFARSPSATGTRSITACRSD